MLYLCPELITNKSRKSIKQMNTTKLNTTAKTIDIQSKEWFDKVNGNSYFAGTITVNYGMPDEQVFIMPFQYGYDRQDEQQASKLLVKNGLFPSDCEVYGISRYCRENNIPFRRNMQTNCKQRELKQIGK